MGIIIAVVVIIVGFTISGVLHEKQYWKTLRDVKEIQWGKDDEEEYDTQLMKYLREFYDSHPEADDIDEITWNDLELEKVFCQIDHTSTSMGQEVLYDILRKPLYDEDELEQRERLITYFTKHPKERIDFQVALSGMGKVRKFSVYGYLSKIKDIKPRSMIMHLLMQLIFVVLIVACVWKPEKMILILIFYLMFHLYQYFHAKAQIREFFPVFQFILRMIKFSKQLGKMKTEPGELQNQLLELKKHADSLASFSRGSFLMAMGGNYAGSIFDAAFDYVRMFFHLDIIKFCLMTKVIRKKEEDLFAMYRIIGMMDAMVAVASFRAQKKEWCMPELQHEQHPYLYAKELAHPLLDEPVRNTMIADESILITGSNASGKSTFIKAVALNAILAQTIHTALASSYQAGFVRIYSSMALRDDIQGNESYYIVEIKSLKRILDHVKEKDKPPVLCFIDEVLRGTNTVERIASSTQILSWLAQNGALCFAATHDIELTTLLSDYYTNYHFEEQVTEDAVCFDYQLKSGPAMTRNAIRLLQTFGYEKSIIQGAGTQVENFLETGIWSV